MTAPQKEVLRIALAMRGGVSLSVWVGGAVREIDRLRVDIKHSKSPSVLAGVARAVGYRGVEIDVLSGASAGGLNAVILAAAMVTKGSVEKLRDVWLTDADIRCLLRKSRVKTQLSLLDGDYFYERLKLQLNRLMEEAPTTKSGLPAPPRRLDVLLSVTSVVPNPVTASSDPSVPVTEQRIDGTIHLRHRGRRTDFRQD
ncbi:patatin-like phospholipase family protein, partial [Macrococcoides caseolyticum]|uniref:patatin-like phospholipase family protein n=1 Tax=Macrococcoides caseolyticum TaxID=69966 RepID=UPI0018E33584